MTQRSSITSSFESIDHLPVTSLCQTFKGHTSPFSFLSPKPWHLRKMYKHVNHSATFLNSRCFFRYQILGSGYVLPSTVCGVSADMKYLSDTFTMTMKLFCSVILTYAGGPAGLWCCCIISTVNGRSMQSHHFLQSAADPQLGMIGSDQETRAEENQVKRQEFN